MGSHQVDVRSLVLDGLKLQADVSEGEEKTIDQTDVKDILLKIAGLNLPVTQLPIKQVTVPAEENISEADDPAANAVSDSSVSDKTVANKETTPTSANPAAAADPGEDIPWLVRENKRKR